MFFFLICWVCDQFQLCLTPLPCPGGVPEAHRVKSGHCPLLTSLAPASISTSSPRGLSLSALCTPNNKNLLPLLSQHFLRRGRTAPNPHILSARLWNLSAAACSLLSSVAANLRCCLANQMASATDISGPSQLSTQRSDVFSSSCLGVLWDDEVLMQHIFRGLRLGTCLQPSAGR